MPKAKAFRERGRLQFRISQGCIHPLWRSSPTRWVVRLSVWQVFADSGSWRIRISSDLPVAFSPPPRSNHFSVLAYRAPRSLLPFRVQRPGDRSKKVVSTVVLSSSFDFVMPDSEDGKIGFGTAPQAYGMLSISPDGRVFYQNRFFQGAKVSG